MPLEEGSLRTNDSNRSAGTGDSSVGSHTKYDDVWTGSEALTRQGSMYLSRASYERVSKEKQNGERSPTDEGEETFEIPSLSPGISLMPYEDNKMPYEDNSSTSSSVHSRLVALELQSGRSESPASACKSGSSESSPAPASIPGKEDVVPSSNPAGGVVTSPRGSITDVTRDNINLHICSGPAPASIPRKDDAVWAPTDSAENRSRARRSKRPAAGPLVPIPPGARESNGILRTTTLQQAVNRNSIIVSRSSTRSPPGRRVSFKGATTGISPRSSRSSDVRDGTSNAERVKSPPIERGSLTKIKTGTLLTLPGRSLIPFVRLPRQEPTFAEGSPRPKQGSYDRAMAGMRPTGPRRKEGDASSLYSTSESSESSGWEEVASRITELEHLVGESGDGPLGRPSGEEGRLGSHVKPLKLRLTNAGDNTTESWASNTNTDSATPRSRRNSRHGSTPIQIAPIRSPSGAARRITPPALTPGRAKFPLPKAGMSIYGGSPRRGQRVSSLDERLLSDARKSGEAGILNV